MDNNKGKRVTNTLHIFSWIKLLIDFVLFQRWKVLGQLKEVRMKKETMRSFGQELDASKMMIRCLMSLFEKHLISIL